MTVRSWSAQIAKWQDCRVVGGAGRADGRADGWTGERTRGRESGRAGGQAAGQPGDRSGGWPGGRDLNSGGGPCAVIEEPQLLMRKVWITGRDHTSPIEASSAKARASEQANVFWEACRGRCTCDLVDRFDGSAGRVERLRLEHRKGRCGSSETYEG